MEMVSGTVEKRGFFFVCSLLACDLSRSWQDYVQSVSCPLSTQWRHVASSPLPSAQVCPKKENFDAHQGNNKGKEAERAWKTNESATLPLLLCYGRHEVRHGEE